MELTPPSKDNKKRTVFFENPDMDYMAQHFVGNLYRCFVFFFEDYFRNVYKNWYFNRYRENIVIPKSNGPVQIKTNEEKMIEKAVESCGFKSFTACVMGEWVLCLVMWLKGGTHYRTSVKDHSGFLNIWYWYFVPVRIQNLNSNLKIDFLVYNPNFLM